MNVLTNEQMRRADAYTIEIKKVPSLTLMERAGSVLADEVEKLSPKGKIVCVCGGGNNGGDGFVCARLLSVRGYEVETVCYAEKFSADCAHNKDRWLEQGNALLEEISDCACIVDCLYGTGFHGSLLGKDEQTVLRIQQLKAQGAFVLSADIPSGVCGENGAVEGVAVYADKTLCIGEYKTGVFLGDGIDHAGEIKKADIGITLPDTSYARCITSQLVRSLLPKRKRNSHKGSYGKAAILAGSIEYTGAAYLATAACLRSGVGYTTLYIPKDLLPYYLLKAPEALLKRINEGSRYEFNEKNLQALLEYDSVAVGMGMGVSLDVANCVEYLLKHYTGKLIIDADGLNSLAAYKKEELCEIFAQKKCDVLLTPHKKEFSRLSGKSMEEIEKEGIYAPVAFAGRLRANVLLKNAVSILTDGKEIALNVTGNSGQAKGGSGDVLSGLIVGLCASGATVFDGAIIGAFLTGRAAEIAAKNKSEYTLTACDIIDRLGEAFGSL